MSLDAKQVVIGSLGKSGKKANIKKNRYEHSSRMQTEPEMANAHLSIFKIVTGEKPAWFLPTALIRFTK